MSSGTKCDNTLSFFEKVVKNAKKEREGLDNFLPRIYNPYITNTHEAKVGNKRKKKMKQKLLFVFNPHSGTGEICKHLAEVLDVFTQRGYEVVAYPTQAAGDGKRKVLEEGENYERIVVAGGDGMLHEVLNGVMRLNKEVVVGYIPSGTVNDFATTHRLPKNNIMEAAKIAAGDNIRLVDVGKFGDTYFSYVAAFGIATNVAYDTDQKAKKRWRILAYVANIFKSLLGRNKFKAACRKMTIDTGEVVIKGKFVFGAIYNSLSIGGVKNFIDKEVVLDDGLIEGLFIEKSKNLKAWEQLGKGLLTRDFNSPGLVFVRAKRFQIYSEEAAWTLDGENGGKHTQIVVSAQQKALHIACPKEEGVEEKQMIE